MYCYITYFLLPPPHTHPLYPVAPGKPLNLSVAELGPTWANLHWQEPLLGGVPGVARYVVMATGDNVPVVTTTTELDVTRLNMTGLLPNVTYNFRVQGVAKVLGVVNAGAFGDAMRGETETTG